MKSETMRPIAPAASLVLAVCFLAAALAAPASAQSAPTRTPGLWETTTITKKGRTTAKECIDAETDRLVLQLTAVLTCRTTDFKQTTDGYAAGASCTAGGITVDNKITVTGDFDSWARAEAVTTMTSADGDAGSNRVFSTAIEARRLGECKPGQIPGDLILPNGKIVHVNPSRKR